jgi:hypothetical protein
MTFRIVFWDVLPCKIIVDRRFRGTCCLHHQVWVSTEVSEVRAASIIRYECRPKFQRYVLPPSSGMSVDRRFRGTCCLHHQGWNVGRQLFYTAVHPRRQFWTSYSPPWELEISRRLLSCSREFGIPFFAIKPNWKSIDIVRKIVQS